MFCPELVAVVIVTGVGLIVEVGLIVVVGECEFDCPTCAGSLTAARRTIADKERRPILMHHKRWLVRRLLHAVAILERRPKHLVEAKTENCTIRQKHCALDFEPDDERLVPDVPDDGNSKSPDVLRCRGHISQQETKAT